MKRAAIASLLVLAVIAIIIAVTKIDTPVKPGKNTDQWQRIEGAKDTQLHSNYKVGEKSQNLFDSLMDKAKYGGWTSLPIGKLMGKLGLEFIGYPYVSGTLDTPGEEVCVINLTGLDCVTYFENVLGMGRILKQRKYSINDLAAEVEKSRYRGGKLKGYTSRLHYTADWIYDNDKKGIIEDITRELGGRPIRFDVGFMSENPKYYPALTADSSLIEKMSEIERNINSRNYYFIPKNEVAGIENKLETGDIIAITTNLEGLDYSHTGMIYKDKKGVARFLHASQTKKKVILDVRMSDYLKSVQKHTGISILRPVEPRKS